MATPTSLVLSTRSTVEALRHPVIRNFSTTRLLAAKKPPAPHKPLVLEKPLKFNPPSHGARLPKKRMAQHYGGQLSQEEIKAQDRRDYPTMMPPQGTWSHWFWTNRTIHVVITAGTLLVLGISTYFMNFAHTSPFAHLLPPISEFSEHPINFIQTYLAVMKMHSQHNSQLAFESRSKKMDDVLKRQAFQMAHKTEKGPMEKYFGLGRKEPEVEETAVEEKPEAVEEEKPKKRFVIF